MPSEKVIEGYLRDRIRDVGGVALKWTSPGYRSVPDRIVLLPERILFVEVKATGKSPTPAQEREHARIRSLGHDVRVIDSRQQVDDLIREIRAARLSKQSR